MKKLVAALLTVVAALGIITIAAPVQTAEARPCVLCPDIVIECNSCQIYHPRTCERCAYCENIKGCKF